MKNWVKILLGIIMVLLVVGVMLFWFIYHQPPPDYQAAPAEFELSAGELYGQYVTNEQRANEQYLGRMIQVEGAVSELEQVQDLVIVSFYFEEGLFGQAGVRCTMLEDYHARALQLIPGQGVVIKGLLTGFTGSDVILEHCTLEEGADPPED